MRLALLRLPERAGDATARLARPHDPLRTAVLSLVIGNDVTRDEAAKREEHGFRKRQGPSAAAATSI
jgi:hypothetical protein